MSVMNSPADKTFAHEHARAYAATSLSYGSRAGDYADWYVATYWTDEGGLGEMPGHERAWTHWLKEVGLV